MARNSSGTMSSVNGPYVVGTVIDQSQVNARLTDIESELTDSLCRSDKGGMTGALKGTDGTVSAPAVAFTSEPGTGLYRIGNGDLGVAILGTKRLELTATGLTVTGALAISGLLTGAATTPVSITPNAGFTAGNGLAYWRSPDGIVRIKGKITNTSAGLTGNVVTSSPLPAGFRPLSDRSFVCSDGNSARIFHFVVSNSGIIICAGDSLGSAGFLQGPTAYLDTISFLAEA